VNVVSVSPIYSPSGWTSCYLLIYEFFLASRAVVNVILCTLSGPRAWRVRSRTGNSERKPINWN
jgi:hypothetical protein